jgi:hypothetical protein
MPAASPRFRNPLIVFSHRRGIVRAMRVVFYSAVDSYRHCEERSDEAIHLAANQVWIASLRSQ